ncbi:hypothetical protein FC83_GL000859 [Agrilactobacillus composti DSM 18527 = JCM 14202]|uniref:Uncharacterized protein n=1 Tax=Agrilactobacillus composti DSM 18527 = JCM 14202 TaxID=1423734 RepID=X0PRD5_9LACO|nr:hypothetical protein FC83_GL000859 [Agrilactobacillus composti DSM 18527 = JCM 14202]GAF39711.1 hypothetical protein JCM14202_1582 [Agrilactobacillus composti DSM 18527 = JCM 14202]
MVCFEDDSFELLELEAPQAVKETAISAIAPIVNNFFILHPPYGKIFLFSISQAEVHLLISLHRDGAFSFRNQGSVL